MQIGVLGDIVFQVNSTTVKTLTNFQWSGSARYAEHQRHLMNSLTEFTGLDPDNISFDIELSSYLGVKVMDEIVKMWDYEREGRPVPLVIGEKAYGKYKWCIRSHKTRVTNYDKYGNVTSATVSVDLLEYLER